MPWSRPALQRHARGSVLLVTVVLMAVLLVVGAALVIRSSRANGSAQAKQKYDAGLSCAEGARELLLSQFRAFNVNISGLTLNTTVNGQQMASGHYDNFGIQSIRSLAQTGVYASAKVEGLSNRNITTPLGGAPYVFTVVCSDTTGQARQTEVEFFIRFGL